MPVTFLPSTGYSRSNKNNAGNTTGIGIMLGLGLGLGLIFQVQSLFNASV
ncbi:MAG TPA: hypothetical protein VGN15_11055 [Ktedonobacteraceae bacterium]|nr:hypothetical protein [Ktedonobacteraceae bacterium]